MSRYYFYGIQDAYIVADERTSQAVCVCPEHDNAINPAYERAQAICSLLDAAPGLLPDGIPEVFKDEDGQDDNQGRKPLLVSVDEWRELAGLVMTTLESINQGERPPAKVLNEMGRCVGQLYDFEHLWPCSVCEKQLASYPYQCQLCRTYVCESCARAVPPEAGVFCPDCADKIREAHNSACKEE